MTTNTNSVSGFSIGQFTGHSGGPIHTATWAVADAKANVIILHGFAEHSARYDALAGELNNANLTVHAFDFASHGRSGGTPGDIRDFNDLVYDAQTFIRTTSSSSPNQPIFLVSHSVGSLVAVDALAAGKVAALVRGAVLLSPLVEVPERPPEVVTWALRAASSLVPKLRTTAVNPSLVTSDTTTVAEYAADPYVFHDKIGLRTATELLRGGRLALKVAPDVKVPTLLMYGSGDQLSVPTTMRKLSDALGSSDKTVREFPDMGHELLSEPVREQVVSQMIEWILRQADA